MIRALLSLLVIVLLQPTAPASDLEKELALDKQLNLAMREASTIQGRTAILAQLAFSEDTESEALAHHARRRLVEAGRQGMQAISDAFYWAEKQRYTDLMLASMQARDVMHMGTSPETSRAIDRALWFGTPDAKRLAMRYLARRPIPVLLLPVMDAAYDHPQLLPSVIDTLALIKNDKARFFLADQLQSGSLPIRTRAAQALSIIGGRGLEYLRGWALSDNAEMRQIAFRALLPNAKVGDLSTLYEYLALFPDDDPELLDALRARAEQLEEAILAQEEVDARTPAIDD